MNEMKWNEGRLKDFNQFLTKFSWLNDAAACAGDDDDDDDDDAGGGRDKDLEHLLTKEVKEM